MNHMSQIEQELVRAVDGICREYHGGAFPVCEECDEYYPIAVAICRANVRSVAERP